MSDSVVYIQNTSGSQLEVATVSLIMEKDAISSEPFPLSQLQNSGEIKKYQQLHFIQLLTAEQAAKLRTPAKLAPTAEELTEEVLGSIEQPTEVQEALTNLRKGLDALEALITGKSVISQKTKPTPKPPTSESEQGTHEESSTEDSAREDEDESIPDTPPAGMSPMNDPVKKFFGKPPYNTPLGYQDQLKYITNCNDIGILREIAMFAPKGRVKDLTKKKLREAKSMAKVS